MTFLGLCAYFVLKEDIFRAEPIEFSRIPEGAVLYLFGVGRKQETGLKIGNAEKFDPPEVAAFGNHQIKFFGAEGFGRKMDRNYLFQLLVCRHFFTGIARLDHPPSGAGQTPETDRVVFYDDTKQR